MSSGHQAEMKILTSCESFMKPSISCRWITRKGHCSARDTAFLGGAAIHEIHATDSRVVE